jgi:hypothetical protein
MVDQYAFKVRWRNRVADASAVVSSSHLEQRGSRLGHPLRKVKVQVEQATGGGSARFRRQLLSSSSGGGATMCQPQRDIRVPAAMLDHRKPRAVIRCNLGRPSIRISSGRLSSLITANKSPQA